MTSHEKNLFSFQLICCETTCHFLSRTHREWFPTTAAKGRNVRKEFLQQKT